ncbi:uncharacterized protein LOC110838366 isoform X1 [Zootermopsis nevadensis]|uniref:Uncharacterized protein n=2 Tax=Zootermopsis nevadensis TaxID=136037 RepID=A0A067RU85_ZOONE|nr:uncharacterized protein LOC110838366 isoform X1 [Zootermopsis nevadensis]KDR23404.1 hypothetical protein L798_05372 [Zootermopsis nevadensis]
MWKIHIWKGPQRMLMMMKRYTRVGGAGVLLALGILLLYVIFWCSRKEPQPLQRLSYRPELFDIVKESIFTGFNNETGSKNGEYIIPNIIHFLFFGESRISYVAAVCVLAAFKNQHPEKILVHTDVDSFRGPHWEKLKNTPNLTIEVHKIQMPNEIFGQKINHVWHAGDVTRIKILMDYGGIFLDNDSYLVRSLDCFRKYEMALGLDENGYIGTQVLVAHKEARFLRLWLETYREYYPDLWYFNAGQKPALEILWHKPELVHSVRTLFGVHDLSQELYRQYNWKEWRNYHTIHLLIRHRHYLDSWWNFYWWPELNEINIHDYPMTFGQMARDVYDFK